MGMETLVKYSERLSSLSIVEMWRQTMSQIPSVFGRLVYLSSRRDQNTGNYQHYGLAHIFGEEETDRTLRTSHEETFRNWLCFTLEEQKADLDLYLSLLQHDKRTILDTWLRLTPYRYLAPLSARAMERDLYLADFEALLELLKNQYQVSQPDPGA